MHSVHQSIPHFTSAHGARAHPFETFVTYGWYGVAGALLGSSVEATFCGGATAVLLMSAHHVNADTSIGVLRHLLVITEMHCWHHNVDYPNARNCS
jgi:sterol desaturase/sphingolipid hydroxylase (fatty acid hydroxylase superfamily)